MARLTGGVRADRVRKVVMLALPPIILLGLKIGDEFTVPLCRI